MRFKNLFERRGFYVLFDANESEDFVIISVLPVELFVRFDVSDGIASREKEYHTQSLANKTSYASFISSLFLVLIAV